MGSASEVSLKVKETDISNLTATIKSPSGREDDCILKRLANGHLGTDTFRDFFYLHLFCQLS